MVRTPEQDHIIKESNAIIGLYCNGHGQNVANRMKVQPLTAGQMVKIYKAINVLDFSRMCSAMFVFYR